jgi:tryptophanyl-tRNA synthetase
MLCSVPRAQRIPTLKEAAEDLGIADSYSVGPLTYPILIAADILMFNADVGPRAQRRS